MLLNVEFDPAQPCPKYKLGGIASICFRFHFLQTLRMHPQRRGVRGLIRSEILWEIQKCSLPGRPSSQNWIKSKSIYHFLMNFDAFFTVFLILLNFGWMVDLAMSIFVFLTKFLIFWHPRHPRVCICSNLKPLFETDTVFPRKVSAETILFWTWPYVMWPLITVHKSAETIQGRKLFMNRNYSRKCGSWDSSYCEIRTLILESRVV